MVSAARMAMITITYEGTQSMMRNRYDKAD